MAIVKYLLDTSVVIEAIRLRGIEVEGFLRIKYGRENYLSTITIAEIFSGQSAQKKEVEQFLRYLIACFKELSINQEEAILAGRLRCFYKIDMADALIAATAINSGLVLATRNQKDFRKVPGLKIIKPK